MEISQSPILLITLLIACTLVGILLGVVVYAVMPKKRVENAINIPNQLEVGNLVDFKDLCGKIIEVNQNTITLQSEAGELCVIPTTLFLKNSWKIKRQNNDSKIHTFTVNLPYKISPSIANDVLRNSVLNLTILDVNNPPEIFLTKFTDSAMLYKIVIFCQKELHFKAQNDILSNVYYQLLRRDLSIQPYQLKKNDMVQTSSKIPAHQIKTHFNNNKFFKQFSDEVKDYLVSNAITGIYGPNETIIKPHMINEKLYVIHSGELEVLLIDESQKEIKVANLTSGQIFGEFGLLLNEISKFIVRSTQESILFSIDRNTIKEIALDDEQVFSYLYAMIEERKAANKSKVSQNHENLAQLMKNTLNQ